jgi:serine/threonine-protein kinase
LPFDAESYPGLILAIAQAEPRQLTEVRPELPAELQDIVLRALGKRREDRYSSVEDLVQALLPFASTRSPEATKSPFAEADGAS